MQNMGRVKKNTTNKSAEQRNPEDETDMVERGAKKGKGEREGKKSLRTRPPAKE